MTLAYKYAEKIEGNHSIYVANPNHEKIKDHLKLAAQIIKDERGFVVYWTSIKRIGLYYIDGQLVALKALKYHSVPYIKGIYRSAGIEQGFDHIKYELGYSWTRDTHRGQGLSSKLSDLILEPDLIDKTFLTTDTNNTPVHKLAKKYGYERIGKEWPGRVNKLILFAKPIK
jgi:RimJ/RimL family protein N-acetyltransferase